MTKCKHLPIYCILTVSVVYLQYQVFWKLQKVLVPQRVSSIGDVKTNTDMKNKPYSKHRVLVIGLTSATSSKEASEDRLQKSRKIRKGRQNTALKGKVDIGTGLAGWGRRWGAGGVHGGVTNTKELWEKLYGNPLLYKLPKYTHTKIQRV